MNRQLIHKVTFVITLLVVFSSLALALYGLRRNNLHMSELRTAVFQADEAGDEQELEEALQELRQYVLAHMNTDLQPRDAGSGSAKPIQLPYRYYQDNVTAWQKTFAKAKIDPEPLNQARQICESDDYSISRRPGCLFEQIHLYQEEELRANPEGSIREIPPPSLPPLEFYAYNFPSPVWSPDLPGWSLIIFILSIPALLLRLLI